MIEKELIYWASRWAREGGEIVMSQYGLSRPVVEQEKAHDLKLQVDRLSEEVICGGIKSRFPGHGILTEEGGFFPGEEPFSWVIDPLDGSVNYFHNLAYFGVSLACFDQPRPWDKETWDDTVPLIGVVFLPCTGELYAAVRGKGAWLNGKLLDPPDLSLDQAMVTTHFSPRNNLFRDDFPLMNRLIEKSQKIRSFGATAVDLVNTAAGRLGGVVQKGSNLWDFAGGALILQETGGGFKGRKNSQGRWDITGAGRGTKEELFALI